MVNAGQKDKKNEVKKMLRKKLKSIKTLQELESKGDTSADQIEDRSHSKSNRTNNQHTISEEHSVNRSIEKSKNDDSIYFK